MKNLQEQEDVITTKIENQTQKIPSDVFLFSAIGAIGISFALKCMNKKDYAAFIEQLVAPILLLAIYNKLEKSNILN